MKLALHHKIIIGLILGIAWAFFSSYMSLTKFTIDWIYPFGQIFVNLLKMIAAPLVMFSIIKGVADMKDIAKLGKIGVRTLTIYVVTTVLAVTLGLGLVNAIKPGKYTSEETRIQNRLQYEFWAEENNVALKDDQVFLTNPKYDEYKEKALAKYNEQKEEMATNSSIASKKNEAKAQKDASPLQFIVDMVPQNFFDALTNNRLMLQIIFFAIFFGISLLLIPQDKSGPVVAVVDGINEIFLKMVDLIMKASPFLVFALLSGKFTELAGNDPNQLIETIKGLGMYSLVVVIGLGLMIFVVYPTIMLLLTKGKVSYGGFFKRISPAQFLAFSTSSSAATLPVTIECVRDRIGVSKEITSFVLPIGATVNMDGTSLYQAVAAIFIAQYFYIDLDFATQLNIVLLATLASIGSAAVPSAGLVMLMIVLGSIGLNEEWIAIIIPIDRILDMCRTVVNVTGDATVATIIASTENELNLVSDEELAKMDA